jgi:5'-3' exonuclease
MESVDIGKNVSLLFDFNNLAIRSYFGVKEITEDPDNIQWGLWKHSVFNSIYTTLWKFKNVSEVVIAVDDSNSWRKAVYSRYKESRKEKKKESIVDWTTLYAMMNKLASEFKHHMPFKMIKVKSAEADDVIGILVKYFKNPCVIVARDEDYFQCFAKNKNLRVYDPISQVLYAPEDIGDVKDFLLKLVFCGQKKDDIPNILTPDDWGLTKATEGKRRPGFGEKAFLKMKDNIKEFIEKGYQNKYYITEKNKQGNIDLSKNLKRNRLLMDFDKIPNTVVDRILQAYNRSNSLPPIDNVYKWFSNNHMKVFMENITRVENKLLELY